MKYRVLVPFTDKETGKVYQFGDSYPANKKNERLDELSSATHDFFDEPLIMPVQDDEPSSVNEAEENDDGDSGI